MPLLGAYQLQNAAAALAAVDAMRELGVLIPASAVQAGFAQTRWQGRFEMLSFKPVMVADGAHTPYSMAQLCASLQAYFAGRRIHFILGTLRDKDSLGILAAAGSAAATMVFCDMDSRRATPASQLLELWRSLPRHDNLHNQQDGVASNLQEALHMAQSWAGEDDVICIAGSLHLVAEAERIILEKGRRCEGRRVKGRMGEGVKI